MSQKFTFETRVNQIGQGHFLTFLILSVSLSIIENFIQSKKRIFNRFWEDYRRKSYTSKYAFSKNKMEYDSLDQVKNNLIIRAIWN